MSDHTQDAGETVPEMPAAAQIRGEKIIGADGKNVGIWIETGLIGADFAEEVAIRRAINAAEPGMVIACWSGSPSASTDEPFPDDPSSWTPAAWTALDAALDRLLPILAQRDATLLVRPHHRHVVGDVPSVGRFVRTLGERGIDRAGVLLDAESMLADSMRECSPDDHRRRIREAIRPVACFEIV